MSASRYDLRAALYVGLGWVVVALLLGLWQLYASGAELLYLSTFTDSVSAMWTLATSSSFGTDVLPSIGRFLAGYVIGCLVGVAVGVPVGYVRSLEPWVRPVLEFLRSLPAPAIVPIAILLLGATSWTRIAVIAFGSCWAVLLNAIDGARGVDPLLIDTGRVNRLGTAQILRRIVLPAALPQIFAGLRIALGIALIVMVFSEMIASTSGLGYFILTAQRRFLVPETYGGVLLIGLIGWAFSVLFLFVERRVLSWHVGRLGGAQRGR
jgi:ABC-type nitrate/sulfonate/bicarbonate transport system permease component